MQIHISPRASQALEQRQQPLNLEMELYFSCLIRKRILYPDTPHADAQSLSSPHPKLQLFFRPVMTKVCGIEEVPELEAFPIKKGEKFQPKWLKVDFHKGEWQSEYGYV